MYAYTYTYTYTYIYMCIHSYIFLFILIFESIFVYRSTPRVWSLHFPAARHIFTAL